MADRLSILSLQLPDPKGFLLLLFMSTMLYLKMFSQCAVEIDFNNWSEVGPEANGVWETTPAGDQVIQSLNGDPTFFMSPSSFMNVRITGTIQVDQNTADDDYIGFVFSANSPLSISSGDDELLDFWLLDWKSGSQSSAEEGFSLIRVNGNYDFSDPDTFMPYFWTHNSNENFDIKDQVFGEGLGWIPGVQHSFELVLKPDEVSITLDGNEVINRSDCFNIGHFGFYNFSQENVTYSNFTYEIFSEFRVPSEICADTEFSPDFFNSNCPNANAEDLNGTIDNWFWQFGDENYSFQMLPEHVYSEAGTYEITLTVTDALGCSASSTENVEVLDKASANITAETGCLGELASFTANAEEESAPILGYTWDFNGDGIIDAEGTEVTHTFTTPGTTEVVLTAISSGCNDTVTLLTELAEEPLADFNIALASSRTVVIENLSENAQHYLWDFGNENTSTSTEPNYQYNSDGTYEITLTAFNGDCTDTTSRSLIVIYEDRTFIPTAFSPNGDGNNDVFRVLGSDFIKIELCVYNHWGELIYTGTDPSNGWDGTIGGSLAQAGNYAYSILGESAAGHKKSYSGKIALVR